jgi:hypothetical protein
MYCSRRKRKEPEASQPPHHSDAAFDPGTWDRLVYINPIQRSGQDPTNASLSPVIYNPSSSSSSSSSSSNQLKV